MSFTLLTEELVFDIHEFVIHDHELQGLAKDKSLSGALSRVENRIAYGMVTDAFDLAALYAMAVSQAHAFNDANKRTAFETMVVALELNGVVLRLQAPEAGDKIIALAQGRLQAEDLAAWLREQPLGPIL